MEPAVQFSPESDAAVWIRIAPRAVVRLLVCFAIFLTLATIAGNQLKYHYGHSFGLWRFDLDGEGNVFAWYQASAMLLCAYLLYAITLMQRRSGDRFAPHWLGLAIIFTYLSADKGAQLHEWFTYIVRPVLHTTGLLYFAWLVPAIPIMIIFGFSYLRFLIAMPPPDRKRFLQSGCVFVSGAMVMEAFDGWFAELHGGEGHLSALSTLRYSYLTTIEEDLKMLGIILFVHALLTYIRGHWLTCRVSVSNQPLADETPFK